jgi:hypothetical protein
MVNVLFLLELHYIYYEQLMLLTIIMIKVIKVHGYFTVNFFI